MAKSKSKSLANDPILSELTAIKQLMIIALVRDGLQQNQIAAALGVDNSVITKAFPKGLLKKLKNARGDEE